MKRRALLVCLAASLGTPVLPAHGQTRAPLVGWIVYGDERAVDQNLRTFREGLRDLGYEEGRNIAIEVFLGQYSRERTERQAAELLARKPAAIVTQGYPLHVIVKLTKTTPVVSWSSGDLVDLGYVKSLAHPGGNVTGVQLMAIELVGKRIGVLKDMLPNLKRIAVIADPGHGGMRLEREASQKAADRFGIAVSFQPARDTQELRTALAAARTAGAEALVLFPDQVTNPNRAEIAEFALQHRLPTVSGWSNYADAGHLVTYGPNLRDSYRRTAHYVDRILKGANPATLPVELPTTVELVLNLKTARALGIAVPRSVLVRADRVIE